MALRDRLQRLTGEPVPEQKKEERDRNDTLSHLRNQVDAVIRRRQKSREHKGPSSDKIRHLLVEILAGEERENDHGSYFCVEEVWKPSYQHGNQCVTDFLGADMKALSILSGHNEMQNMTLADGLYLDTETTGLAGGTGTVAFLIGLGWFTGSSFVTHQLFMRDYAEERACLACLSDIGREKRFLITFNGKSFDMNLLGTRFIMNRLPNPFVDLPHLDLLHPTRRLLSHRLENNRLVTVEEGILGFAREGDIPGWEIPERYFRWLRSRRPHLMADVLHHNRLDIISMAALARHLSDIFTEKENHFSEGKRESFAAARLLIDRRHVTEGRDLLRSLSCSTCSEISREARCHLSLMLKREGDWRQAGEIWETMLRDNPSDCFACEELAKWYEHRLKDVNKALNLVKTTLEALDENLFEERQRLRHRLLRLEKRSLYATGKHHDDVDMGSLVEKEVKKL